MIPTIEVENDPFSVHLKQTLMHFYELLVDFGIDIFQMPITNSWSFILLKNYEILLKFILYSTIQKPAIELMLQRVGIQFEGTKHCGLDDSINIAKIVIRMLEDNVELRVNIIYLWKNNFWKSRRID